MRVKVLTIISFLLIVGSLGAKEGNIKEARYYQKLAQNRVWCQLCFRKCTIAEGERGFCRVRENRGGKLYSLVYGKPAGLQIDPIVLEPMYMYHLIPGHRNLCVFTASCNFRCKHCHNWLLSQRRPEEVRVVEYSPAEVVAEAIRQGCKSISHSINEPTVFYEFMYDIAREARQKGLITLFHTNGSISPEPLRELLKYMDGVTVDLKAFDEKFYREISSAELEPVLRTLKIIVEEGVHLEIVNLIIPTLNDDLDKIKEMCIWIRDNLGKDIPLHFTRFSPAHKLTKLPPTPVETLEAAREIAQNVGLKYVYIGNLPGHEGNNTFCPQCKKRLIHRIHFTVLSNKVVDGRCRFCGYEIVGIWK
jgi:pyruvate formate lyase activating enzyme